MGPRGWLLVVWYDLILMANYGVFLYVKLAHQFNILTTLTMYIAVKTCDLIRRVT